VSTNVRLSQARVVAGEEQAIVPDFETLLYEEADGVATVTLNRPDVHNAFNSQMQRELHTLWRSSSAAAARRSCSTTRATTSARSRAISGSR
jgi:1,4-dihydroxy-2-naphthoyl-CoA synthase